MEQADKDGMFNRRRRHKRGGLRIFDVLLLAVLGGLGYYGYGFLHPPAPQPPTPTAAPVQNTQRIVCPVCKGEGQLMLRSQKDCSKTIRLSKGSPDKPYACMVCGGRGFRDLILPPGCQVCPDCGGMGKRPTTPNACSTVRITAKPCMRCTSAGYIRHLPAQK